MTVQHSICILFGGTFDPAYIMTIKALPCQVQTTTNKRNVALLQKHLDDTLRVAPTRGLVQFVAVPEECSGWNGKTVAGEIAEMAGRTEHYGGSTGRRSTTKVCVSRLLVSGLWVADCCRHFLDSDRRHRPRTGRQEITMTVQPCPESPTTPMHGRSRPIVVRRRS